MTDQPQPPIAPTQPDAEARARDAALEAWHGGGTVPAPAAEDDFDFRPPRRSAFPPSFLLIVAAGLAFLALEPTGDLGYTLFGPGRSVDLGRPGAYTLASARSGTRARIAGYPSTVKGTQALSGGGYDFEPLVGVPVLVRTPAHPPVVSESTEPLAAEGRLIRLETTPSTFFDRLFDPASRYTTVRLQFEALGELPPGKPAWLLLDGDLPRSDPWAIGVPLVGWAGSSLFLFLAWRSWRVREALVRSRRRST